MPVIYYRFFAERQHRAFVLAPGATGCTLRELVAHLAQTTGHSDLRHVRFDFQYAEDRDGPRMSSVRDGSAFVPANRALIVRRCPRHVQSPIEAYGGVIVR